MRRNIKQIMLVLFVIIAFAILTGIEVSSLTDINNEYSNLLNKEVVSTDFNVFCKAYKESFKNKTNLQSEEIKEKIDGKKVLWTGDVYEVYYRDSKSVDLVFIRKKFIPSMGLLGYIANIEIPLEEAEKIKKGQKITISAEISNQIYPFAALILEVKNAKIITK